MALRSMILARVCASIGLLTHPNILKPPGSGTSSPRLCRLLFSRLRTYLTTVDY